MMIDGTTADTRRLCYSATQLRYLAGQSQVVALGLQSLVADYGVADYCSPGIARTGELDAVAVAISTLLDSIAAEADDADNAELRMITDNSLASLCVETARSVEPADAQNFWDQLSQSQRQYLISNAPDVVINDLIAAGVTLDPAELAALEAAEAHVVLTDDYWAKFGGSMSLKYCTVRLTKDVSLRVQKMSDGSVLVTVIDHSAAGISPPRSDGPNQRDHPVDVSLTALLGAGTATTFRFGSERDATAAVEQIRQAAIGVIDSLIPDRPIDVLQPWKQWKRVGSALTGDDVAAVLDGLADRLDRVTTSLSATHSAGVSLAKLLGTLGVDGELSAHQQLTVYRSEQVHGGDDFTAAQLKIAGAGSTTISNKGIGRFGIPPAASIDGSVSVEARARDDGTMYLIFSAGGSYATERSAGSSSVKTTTTSGRDYAIDIKIPVTQDNAARVREAVERIADGTGLGDALDSLYDEADITVTTTATTSSSGVAKAGDSKINVNAKVGSSSSRAEVRRKRRHGDWYSQTDAQDRLDDAQSGPCEAQGLPMAPMGRVWVK